MKILTLNCHSWQEENQLEKINYIASVIKENNYDVIALQEVSQLVTQEVVYSNIKKDNFALLINQELKNIGIDEYEFFWDICHIGYDIYEEGICIMTKLPIKESKSFYISKSEDINFWKTRKVVKIKVDYNGKYISFYSCHLGWWKDEESFEYQFNKIIKDFKKEELSFIMGDFNNSATVRNEGYDYMIQKGVFDTYNMAKVKDCGITVKGKIAGWDNNKEDLRLDIVFVNKEIDILASKVIFNDENKKVVSDHFGAEVEINI